MLRDIVHVQIFVSHDLEVHLSVSRSICPLLLGRRGEGPFSITAAEPHAARSITKL